MTALESATRVAFRFHSNRECEILERQGELENLTLLVFMLHMTMLIVFINFQEWNAKHPPAVKMQTQITYFTALPPVEPKPVPVEPVPAVNPENGQQAKSESAPARAAAAPAKRLVAVNRKVENASQSAPASARALEKQPVASAAAVQPKALDTAPTSNQVERSATNDSDAGKAVDGGNGADLDGGGTNTNPAAAGGPHAQTTKSKSRFFDIGPYKREIISCIRENWHPDRDVSKLVVFFRIDRDGELLEVGVVHSSGSKQADRQAVEAVKETVFPPIPEELPDSSLPFQFNFSKFTAAW